MAQLVKVLLVEDDPDDVELTRETLKDSKVRVDMDVVNNGVEAMDYLRQNSPYEDKPRPDIIFLDLNMPRMDGREVLNKLEDDPELRMIPVIVLTTSSEEEDILQSYRDGANCYIQKPVGLSGFRKVVQTVEDFWFDVVKLPDGERS